MTKINNLPMHDLKHHSVRAVDSMFDLVVFAPEKGKSGRVIAEMTVAAESISKAVKSVKTSLEGSDLLVLQKAALPSLGIFSFETTARLHHSVHA